MISITGIGPGISAASSSACECPGFSNGGKQPGEGRSSYRPRFTHLHCERRGWSRGPNTLMPIGLKLPSFASFVSFCTCFCSVSVHVLLSVSSDIYIYILCCTLKIVPSCCARVFCGDVVQGFFCVVQGFFVLCGVLCRLFFG